MGAKTTFECVSVTPEKNKVRLLGRVRPTQNTGMLLRVIQRLLLAAESSEWNMDASKQYFMRGGRLTYGWRFIFQGENIETHLSSIITIINNTDKVVQQLTEVRLHGASPNRNMPTAGGKGARPTLGG